MLGSIALMIQQKAAEHPEKIAIYVGDENCTYATLAQNNRKAALYLTRKGIKANQRVVVEADHILSYVYFWYGIQLLGATFVPSSVNVPAPTFFKAGSPSLPNWASGPMTALRDHAASDRAPRHIRISL